MLKLKVTIPSLPPSFQQIKKLVYVYLVRYAEEQQDVALLSISTFQKGLKDPNQLIRASALRVLSSIRVPIIAPIMMLAIKESVTDMSPYVRKTAANAIPKLYSLDPEQKEQLEEVIEKLLKDQTTVSLFHCTCSSKLCSSLPPSPSLPSACSWQCGDGV